MGSRDKDQPTPHHQPLLSSLVVRPSSSDGGGGGTNLGGGGRGGDYETGEVRREHPPYSRSDRYADEPGYRIRAGSTSPVRRRDADYRFSSDFDHLGGGRRGRELGGGRDPGRYRDISPPHGRGRVGGRAFAKGFDGPGLAPGPVRGEGTGRNNPNVRPREGDWYCSDPSCGNLNFARREYCNSCNKYRYGPGGSPRRAYPGPPPLHAPPRRIPGPPTDRSPGRSMNGYRSPPPRAWPRDGPREFGAGGLPPPRYEVRLPEHHSRRDRFDHAEDSFRGRTKFERPIPAEWGPRDRGRDGFFNDRKVFERRPHSPPLLPPALPPQRGRWGHDVRERSRSPVRGPPQKDYLYVDRARDGRRGLGRDHPY